MKLAPTENVFTVQGQGTHVLLFSLNWQHHKCQNPRPNPEIKTLFVDHMCVQPSGAGAPSPANNPLLGSFPTAGAFPLGVQGVGLSS